MGRVDVIGGEKGGTGKSTISVDFAIMLTLMKHDIILVDADKQGSARNLINHRNGLGIVPTPPCVQILGKHLNSELEHLSTKYSHIIVDVGGRDSVELRAAMACSVVNTVYSPVQPSEFDLETLSTMDELTYFSLAYNKNLKSYIVLNQCQTHARSTVADESVELIESFDNLSLARSRLGHRVAFSYAKSKHQSVVEFEGQKVLAMPDYQAKNYPFKASKEICSLYEEVFREKFTALPFKFESFAEDGVKYV